MGIPYIPIFSSAQHFYLKLPANEYRSAKLSSASAVRWESLSKGDSV